MTDNSSCDTPAVLLIVFNRPDATRQTFEAIRRAAPVRLYVACDGPRENHPDDPRNIRAVIDIIRDVDWQCEVRTLNRQSNRGCRRGPAEAIDWFFAGESEGIILEDDCIPSPDFFAYCRYMLDTYRENRNIWHIGGNNFGWKPAGGNTPVANHYFGSLAQVWGWATWRDRWQDAEQNPFYLERAINPGKWPLTRINRLNKLTHLELLKDGLDAWDYQWQISILDRQGLAVYPVENLVSNIGDGPSATHTQIDTDRLHLPTGQWTPPATPVTVTRNPHIDAWFARKMGLNRAAGPLKLLHRKALICLKEYVYKFSRILLQERKYSIVIASTGRSASTLLFDNLADSWVSDRRRLWSCMPATLLSAAIKQTCWRLAGFSFQTGLVYKTHDIPHHDIGLVSNVRFIFIYGDPLYSAQSVMTRTRRHGEIWLDEHLYNLSGHGNLHDIPVQDILNYEKLLTAWYKVKSENVLLVDYADLWDRLDEINQFTGFSTDLPERQERDRIQEQDIRFDQDLYDRLRALYLEAAEQTTT